MLTLKEIRFGRKNGKERSKMVVKERQGEEEVGGEYRRKLSKRLREARTRV